MLHFNHLIKTNHRFSPWCFSLIPKGNVRYTSCNRIYLRVRRRRFFPIPIAPPSTAFAIIYVSRVSRVCLFFIYFFVVADSRNWNLLESLIIVVGRVFTCIDHGKSILGRMYIAQRWQLRPFLRARGRGGEGHSDYVMLSNASLCNDNQSGWWLCKIDWMETRERNQKRDSIFWATFRRPGLPTSSGLI